MRDIRAAVLNAAREPLSVETLQIDEPDPHEVLVRTSASGVCHSDLHAVEGNSNTPPVVLGHEPAGIVEAVGSEVATVTVGDHVVACTSFACGACPQCVGGYPHLCSDKVPMSGRLDGRPRLLRDGQPVEQMSGLGSFAEMMLVHERALVKIKDEVPLDRAALCGCAVTTGTGAALNTAGVSPGSAVAVFGIGGVGISIIQGARIAGARQIIGIDLKEEKLAMAKHFGATHVINGNEGDVVKQIKRLSEGGVDYSFDAVGSKVLAEQCLYCLRPRGLATLVGAIYPVTDKIELRAGHFFVEKRIQGCYMGSNRFQQDVPRYLDLYLQGRLNLDDMISERMPLDRVNEAFAAMKGGEVARTVLVFD